jgi:membrane protein CcdC involved in cytochrome C biogenesis
MLSHQNNCKHICHSLFCHFLPNFVILLPPIFVCNGHFLGPLLRFFDIKKFDHLATVKVGIEKSIIFLYRKLFTVYDFHM